MDLLKKVIASGEFSPFTGILYSQDGIVQDDPGKTLTPEEIITNGLAGRECDRKHSKSGRTERLLPTCVFPAGRRTSERQIIL